MSSGSRNQSQTELKLNAAVSLINSLLRNGYIDCIHCKWFDPETQWCKAVNCKDNAKWIGDDMHE